MTKSTARTSSGRSRARKPLAPAGSSFVPVARKAARGSLSSAASARLFASAQARAVKNEICAVGRKLWLRQLVDGNGGNISCRIGPNEVICTPTLISKYDLTPAGLCMVDLDGNQIAGKRQVTSEILLHLEIYKNVPEAKAVVHCHPPHATAYAVTGQAPPGGLMPEYEVFIGEVALAPYETPGTAEFARTVLPYARRHNAILLSNHGAVCWAGNLTVAEWNCEVLETYCQVLMLARQLGAPLAHIPEPKGAELAARRRSMGFPDVKDGGIAPAAPSKTVRRGIAPARTATLGSIDLEKLVERVTREVLRQMGIAPAPPKQ